MFTVKGTQILLVTLVFLVAQFWAQNCGFRELTQTRRRRKRERHLKM